VIDLASRTREPLLGTIIDEGTVSRLWTPEAVRARLDQLPHGVPGRAKLARLLTLRIGEGAADSRLEQRVFRVLAPLYPGYTIHHRVVLDGQIVEMDIAWVDQKIDGEVDGLAPRAQSRTKLERSARRANLLGAHGWRIVHFTHQMSDHDLVAQLAPYFRR
jgi:very-short-patch-repair endonuclease